RREVDGAHAGVRAGDHLDLSVRGGCVGDLGDGGGGGRATELRVIAGPRRGRADGAAGGELHLQETCGDAEGGVRRDGRGGDRSGPQAGAGGQRRPDRDAADGARGHAREVLRDGGG